MRRKFPLDIQMPLLHVRPNRPIDNDAWRFVVDERRGERTTAADASVPCRVGGRARTKARGNVGLAGCEHSGGRTFKRLSIGFVSVAVLEEDAISAANGHLSITVWIPGESDARRRIEQMPLLAARKRSSGNGRCGKCS